MCNSHLIFSSILLLENPQLGKKKKPGGKIIVVYAGSDTISCCFAAWEHVHCVSQITARSLLASAVKEFL